MSQTSPERGDHAHDTQKILSTIRASIAKKHVELPPLPHVAADLLRLTSPQDPSFPDIAQCIGRDPVIAAKLVGMANSAFFRGRRDFRTIEDAIVRLGTKTIRAFAIGAAVSSLAPVPGNWGPLRSRLWNHCVATGVGAKMLAARTRQLEVDVLFLGGLFHDVGNLTTLHLALEQDPDLPYESLLSLLDALRVEAGVRMLAHWDVPQIYQLLMRLQHGLARGTEGLTGGARLIRYASDASKALGIGFPNTAMDLAEHPLRESLGLTEDVVRYLEDELAARVDELVPFLTH